MRCDVFCLFAIAAFVCSVFVALFVYALLLCCLLRCGASAFVCALYVLDVVCFLPLLILFGVDYLLLFAFCCCCLLYECVVDCLLAASLR